METIKNFLNRIINNKKVISLVFWGAMLTMMTLYTMGRKEACMIFIAASYGILFVIASIMRKWRFIRNTILYIITLGVIVLLVLGAKEALSLLGF